MHHIQVFIILECQTSVFSHSVVEVVLNPLLKLLLEWHLAVVMLEAVEEPLERSTVQVIVQSVVPLQDLDEDSHHVRVDGHSKQQHEGLDESLNIASRVEVTEAYGRH